MAKIKILLIIIFLIVSAAVFGFLKIRKNSQNNIPEIKNEVADEITAKKEDNKIENIIPEDQDVFQGNREEYKKIIGDWDTGCLIADPKNPSAEKHIFIIKENGTAQHRQWKGTSCETLEENKIFQNYKVGIPEIGKINFIALDKNSDNIYDIYKSAEDILYFGHGPRDWYPLSLRNFGGSIETRFDALNDFLKYKKQV